MNATIRPLQEKSTRYTACIELCTMLDES